MGFLSTSTSPKSNVTNSRLLTPTNIGAMTALALIAGYYGRRIMGGGKKPNNRGQNPRNIPNNNHDGMQR